MPVLTALITPMHEDGSVDLEALKFLLGVQREAGVDGVVLLGTTGEAPTLGAEERRAIIETAVAEMKGELQLVVGTGSNSTESTIAASREAEQLGADGLLVVAPYYNRPTQAGIFGHFEALSAAVSIPILVYNIPGRTGVEIEALTMREIAKLPGIAGTKECSGSIVHAAEVMRHTPDDFQLLAGDDLMLLPMLAIGGHGIISTLGNLTPRMVVDLVQAAKEGRWEEARRIYYEMIPLAKGLFIETNPIPVKEAMRYCGLPAGPCRLPLSPMGEQHRDALHTLLGEVMR
jgi:4-hydroxy-tetrahydrodipicolinate synthase